VRIENEINELQGVKSEIADRNRMLVPKKVFFTTGIGVHEDPLVSFELALRDAGIERFNLVTVSSIFPPQCEIVEMDEGMRDLYPGQVVFCVMAKETSSVENKKIYATIGCAIPEDPSLHGYLTEYHGEYNGEDVGRRAEQNARYMLETAFGVKAGRTFNVTRVADVRETTTVLSAAVFVL